MSVDKFKESHLYNILRMKDDWGLSYKNDTPNNT